MGRRYRHEALIAGRYVHAWRMQSPGLHRRTCRIRRRIWTPLVRRALPALTPPSMGAPTRLDPCHAAPLPRIAHLLSRSAAATAAASSIPALNSASSVLQHLDFLPVICPQRLAAQAKRAPETRHRKHAAERAGWSEPRIASNPHRHHLPTHVSDRRVGRRAYQYSYRSRVRCGGERGPEGVSLLMDGVR